MPSWKKEPRTVFSWSSSTRRSGKPSMNPRAASVIASRPIAGEPPLMVS